LVTEGLCETDWGSKRKATVMASTVVDHTLPLLPSVCQPKFLWVTLRFSFARLSHASRSRSRKCCVIVLRSLPIVLRTYQWEAQQPADLKREHKLVHHQIYILHALYFNIYLWDSVSFNNHSTPGILKN
jgi:hypothetical protein